MAVSNDPAGPVVVGDDLSALSWVQDELRRSLELAHKALRRYLKEQEQQGDLDTIDPAVLRQARTQLHQSLGVLELVGLGRAGAVLRAAEAALQRLGSRPKLITAAAVATIERGSFALLDFIDRKLASKPVSTLAMFPQYRALQELAGATRIHPADLWTLEWSWRDLAPDAGVLPRQPDEPTVSRIEADLLALMRGAQPSVAAHMSELFAGLAAAAHAQAPVAPAGEPNIGASSAAPGAARHRLATLWQLAAGVFEAQADGLLLSDPYIKRMGSRLLSQLRAGEGAEPSERLAHDLLFFCGQAQPRQSAPVGPRLAAVRRAYGLAGVPAVDYDNARLGRFDPAWVAQARKRVVAAKEVWSAVAGGDLPRLSGLSEQFALVADSLARLYPDGGVLGRSLQVAAAHTTATGAEPPADLAMEVATALLFMDASLDDGDFEHPEGAHRVQRLAQRIDQVRQARDPGTLDLWMEELYRRVSDRQTMGSVVQELRASLSEIEKAIDQYFRDPARRALLIPVPGQLSAMRGVLSVLGLDQASQAVLRMRDDVDTLANTEVDAAHASASGSFNRLADNLGALSFLIDMVSVQPQMAKSLFRFDAESGSLSAVMARQDRATGFSDTAAHADAQSDHGPQTRPDTDAVAVTLEFDRIVQQANARQRGASQALGADPRDPLFGSHGLPMLDLGGAAAAPSDAAALGRFAPAATPAPAPVVATQPAAVTAPAPARPMAAVPPLGAAGFADDDAEMREIFLDEAQEVLASARQALAGLQVQPADRAALVTARRAFHTLKGSARMMGLLPFGEAAWACEQLYNARLADPQGRSDAALQDFSQQACTELSRWVQALAAGDATAFGPQGLVAQADALLAAAPAAASGPGVQPGSAAAALPPVAGLRGRVPGLPSAADLDLLPSLPGSSPHPVPPAAAPALDLPRLDLTALGQPPVPAERSQPLPVVTVPDVHALMLANAAPPARPVPATPSAQVVVSGGADIPLDLELVLNAAAAPAAVDLVLDELAPVPPAGPVRLPDRTQTFGGPPPVSTTTTSTTTTGINDVALAEPAQADAAAPPAAGADAFRQIGTLRIGIALYNIYLNEADELSRRLGVELAEWALEQHRPVGAAAVALAHSLAGNSGAVGFVELSQLSRLLEHALERAQARGHGEFDDARLFTQAADEIRRLLHLFAAGFLNSPDAELLRLLAERSHAAASPVLPPAVPAASAVAPAPAPVAEWLSMAPADSAASMLGRSALRPFQALQPPVDVRAGHSGPAFDEDIDQLDAVDADLHAIFVDEARELLLQLHARLRDWSQQPAERAPVAACMRCLHTFKGSARLAGAMRLGEIAHRLESEVERLSAQASPVHRADVETLMGHADVLDAAFEAMPVPQAAALPAVPRATKAQPGAAVAAAALPSLSPAATSATTPSTTPSTTAAPTPALAAPATTAAASAAPPVPAVTTRTGHAPAAIDWARFAALPAGQAEPAPVRPVGLASTGSVRVRAPLLDRLVNHAGEVSITRARIQRDVGQFKGGLDDLTDNLERLRSQLRDIELQAETQIGTRLEAAKAAQQQFDPLEMDRFTRFQELTRMMAESVADVATVQRSLQRTLQSTEDALAHQARMTRDMQDDLLRTRMVEFEGLSDRLYRVVRQAAKETGKTVRLDIVGGGVEIDRGVLDRMTPAFEHLLRNSVVHGIEPAATRSAAGKDSTGSITLAVSQIGNEMAVEVRDDGAGLDLAAIRARAQGMGLIAADTQADDAALANLIFQPGVTTAATITDLAGRGVGMDVVRTDVNATGGRIETASAPGQGTSFRLVLPLTTAVTQVVMLRCGERTFAVPSTLVELVRRVPLAELALAYGAGQMQQGELAVPFFWLDALLQGTALGAATGRTVAVVTIRSAAQRVMLHVDEVLGNQEVVIKNLGPQLSRVPGLVGMTLLPSGLPALIYNPVALATLYGAAAHQATRQALLASQQAGRAGIAAVAADATPMAPLVLVVDDSLTVRRITQRLLEREGYRVSVAKDGLDGLDKLAVERPAVLLTDIEMPRMDGFDLVRNLRSDAKLAGLPVIMITSRIAQKHRDYAVTLGVQHYLGKPYVEDELLALVARHARPTPAV